MHARHIDAAVELHVNAFPDFFLTFLGDGFLKIFYQAYVENRDAVAYVAEGKNGYLAGVVVGTLKPRGFFRRLLLRRWWSFALACCGSAIKRPMIIPRLHRALFYRGEEPTGVSRALLSSIAVAPAGQRTGVGRALMENWLNAVQAQGMLGAYLTTDANNNEAVNRFYQRFGWWVELTYVTREGRMMNRYIIDLRMRP